MERDAARTLPDDLDPEAVVDELADLDELDEEAIVDELDEDDPRDPRVDLDDDAPIEG